MRLWELFATIIQGLFSFLFPTRLLFTDLKLKLSRIDEKLDDLTAKISVLVRQKTDLQEVKDDLESKLGATKLETVKGRTFDSKSAKKTWCKSKPNCNYLYNNTIYQID